MKNKGFVLMETIVVIVVISVALVTVFASYNKILSKLKTENKYDTSEYIYMTHYVKKYLKSKCGNEIQAYNIFPSSVDNFQIIEYYGTGKCDIKNNNEFKDNEITKKKFPIEKIYILTNINHFNKLIDKNKNDKKDEGEYKNSKFFDAYMIDYIRKLDVTDEQELIIVEYKRPVLKTDGNELKDSKGNTLYETYIASLEW